MYWEDGPLYHMKHRYYHVGLKRWLCADPIGLRGGPNLYAYVRGNPLAWIDPFGLQANMLPGAAEGFAEALANALEAFSNWGADQLEPTPTPLEEYLQEVDNIAANTPAGQEVTIVIEIDGFVEPWDGNASLTAQHSTLMEYTVTVTGTQQSALPDPEDEATPSQSTPAPFKP